MSQYGQDSQYGQQYSQEQQYDQRPSQQNFNQPLQSQASPNSQPPDTGSFPNGTYTITHRDTNAVLNLTLTNNAIIHAKPGAMIHMSGTIQLSGEVNFSFRKLFTGAQMAQSTFSGYGNVALAPILQGDIMILPVGNDGSVWRIGKDAYLASTDGVVKETKSQGFTKALFSGEHLFVYNISGQGLLWLTSYGAVDRIDLQAGEQHIVDNGHLVAWNCEYRIEKAGGGGMTAIKTGEGMVCRFVGPGSVYVQTRNKKDLEEFIRSCVPREVERRGKGGEI